MSSYWECKACNLYNSYSRQKCQACFTTSAVSQPPFTLNKKLPCSELLDIIKTSSKIAQDSGYLVSFNSEQHCIKHNNITFLATLAMNLSKKPKPKIDESQSQKPLKNPFLPPFHLGSHVMDIHNQYRLLLNKYNVVPNHVLIVTKDFVQQTLPLNATDFDVAYKIIQSMDGLCYFNSGPFSGASQPHKHLQVIPRDKTYPIEQFIQNINSEQSQEQKQNENGKDANIKLYKIREYPFIHYVYLMNDNKDDNIYHAYCFMIEKIKNDIEQSDHKQYTNEHMFSYNIILTREYMFIVARKNDIYYNDDKKEVDIGVNGVTFAGTFFCKSKESFSMLEQVGPLNVLNFVSINNPKCNKL